MKKVILCFATAGLIISSMSNMTVNATVGDVIHPIYSTDILTYMDGIPIQGYAIDGKTMICLEDLSNYGFSVYYSDEARALFVNKQGIAVSGFYPIIERGAVGNISGYTYETDIRAYVNGQEIAAENIGGRLAVCAEDLSDKEKSGELSHFPFTGFSKYFMKHVYDDSKRTLNIYSELYEDQLYEENITKADNAVIDRGTQVIDTFETNEYTAHIYQGGYINGINTDGCSAVRYYHSGRMLDTEQILRSAYDFAQREGTSVYDATFSDDGKYILFNGKRSKAQKYSLMGTRNTYEEGEYMLDMDTFALTKVNVQSYELSSEQERPAIWP